ncbi:hypothetical protein DFJ77DRAFT_511869 [Powellomyces hirtus]|nr:hypothetical protein DFJ77DRAFT_511869 [Powellomyces hirtus]
MRGRPVDLNILEPSLPVPFDKRPWFYTQEGRKYWKKRLIVTIRSTFCAFQVRKAFPDFGLSFARNVQGIYIEMNEAFARGDRKALEELVTDTMLTKLNPDLKAASNLGRYEWKAHGELSRPRILTIAAAKVQMEKGGEEHKLVQITVEVNVKQSVALYDRKNALIGGNPNDIKNITEYIVVQRSIGKEGDERGWQIAGKITAPSS